MTPPQIPRTRCRPTHSLTCRWTSLLLLVGFALDSAATERGTTTIYPATQGRVEAANGFVELGYKRQTVLFVLGEPTTRLNDNLWVYRGFQCDLPSARGMDTLVLQFENERLSAFKLVNARLLKASVTRFNARPEKP